MTDMKLTRRKLGSLVAATTVAGMIRPTFAAVEGLASETFDPLPYVHPDLRPIVQARIALMRSAIDNRAILESARQRGREFVTPPLAKPVWEERRIKGAAGQPDIPILLVNLKKDATPRPAILHIHGGGYVFGSAKDGLADLQRLALELDCVILTVDYRLAPETVFPGPLEDCYAALKWMSAHAAELGIDPNRIALKGESAGGGLAAMLALLTRDRGEIRLAYQCLIYPMLDDRTGATVQRPRQQGALVWLPASNRLGWSCLLGVPAGSPRVPAGSVPARVDDLSRLPPTFIGVGTIDLFYEEDLEYARRLAAAGVQVELVVAPGGYHGFDAVKDAPVSRRFNDHLLAALKQGLGISDTKGGAA